jgi:purine-binding chemotaxis protein CheW
MEKTYVLFNLEGQGYAIDINLVIEITEIGETTKVPGGDGNTQGVLNLRGDVISIIDLKRKLGLGNSSAENKQIIVVKKGDKQAGLLIDNARDIRSYSEDLLEEVSLFKTINKKIIENIINAEGEIIIALNVNEII